MASKWTIKIQNPSLGGYAPAYWMDDYPSYGNGNMAGKMKNIDMTSPSYMTQGKGLGLISSTSDTVRSVFPTVIEAETTYGIGEDGVYKIKATSSELVHTVSSAIGEDVEIYAGKAYFSYNKTGDTGDLIEYDLSSAWDDTFWTTNGGTALQSGVPHPMVTAGTSGVMWIADGQYLKEWDGSIATDDAFDTHDSDSVIVDVEWNRNYAWIADVKPYLSGRKQGSVYVWDGTSPSWSNRTKINGEIGALFVENGVTYVIYKSDYDNDICSVGYLDGESVKDLVKYEGSLPNYYEVSTYKGFTVWKSGTDLMAFGAGDKNLNPRLYQFSEVEAGGISNPFGDLLTFDGTNMKKLEGYTTSSYWKSLNIDVSSLDRKSIIDDINVKIKPMSSGARTDISLVDNNGTTKWTDDISYSSHGTRTNIKFNPRCELDNFRVELNATSGSTTNPVEIKSILIKGHNFK